MACRRLQAHCVHCWWGQQGRWLAKAAFDARPLARPTTDPSSAVCPMHAASMWLPSLPILPNCTLHCTCRRQVRGLRLHPRSAPPQRRQRRHQRGRSHAGVHGGQLRVLSVCRGPHPSRRDPAARSSTPPAPAHTGSASHPASFLCCADVLQGAQLAGPAGGQRRSRGQGEGPAGAPGPDCGGELLLPA